MYLSFQRFQRFSIRNFFQVDILKKRYQELRDSVDRLGEEDTIVTRFEAFLRVSFPPAGDIEKLTEELEHCDVSLVFLDVKEET